MPALAGSGRRSLSQLSVDSVAPVSPAVGSKGDQISRNEKVVLSLKVVLYGEPTKITQFRKGFPRTIHLVPIPVDSTPRMKV